MAVTRKKPEIKKQRTTLDATLADLILASELEEAFKKHPAFELADFFRSQLKKSGYTITDANLEKTKEAAVLILKDHGHISLKEWHDCIVWVFSDDRYQDKFWAKVTVRNLGTVIKMFNAFKTKKRQMDLSQKKTRTVDYGNQK